MVFVFALLKKIWTPIIVIWNWKYPSAWDSHRLITKATDTISK